EGKIHHPPDAVKKGIERPQERPARGLTFLRGSRLLLALRKRADRGDRFACFCLRHFQHMRSWRPGCLLLRSGPAEGQAPCTGSGVANSGAIRGKRSKSRACQRKNGATFPGRALLFLEAVADPIKGLDHVEAVVDTF